MSKQQLVFDTTDADTIAMSDSVGAFVRSDDGTLITHHTVGSDEGLDTYILNSSLTIDDGGSSLTVDAVDLDIRDLAFATDSVTSHQGGTWTIDSITNDVSIDDGGNSITVDAIDLDIRDLTAASDSVSSWLKDGTGTAITSTVVGSDTAIDVNVVQGINVEVDLSHVDDSVRLGDGTSFFTSTTIGSDIGLDVNVMNDPNTMNTAIKAKANLLDTVNTAEDVVAVADVLANRKQLFILNDGNKNVYIGESGVTIADGYPLSPKYEMILNVGPAVDIEWIGHTGATGANGQAKLKTLQIS